MTNVWCITPIFVTACTVNSSVPHQIRPSLPVSLQTSQQEYSPVGTQRPWLPSYWGITCWCLTSHMESQETATRTNLADSLKVTRYQSTYPRVNFGTRCFFWWGRSTRRVSALTVTNSTVRVVYESWFSSIVQGIHVSLRTRIFTVGRKRRGETQNILAPGVAFL